MKRALGNAEIVCLSLASVGKSVRGSAKQLGISFGTVATHLNRAILKLQADDINDAISKAHDLGIIESANTSQVSRVVRRSMGLPSKKTPKMRFATIREAIEIERSKSKRR